MVVEIRTYKLKTGTAGTFEKVFTEQSLPMMKRWQLDVVGYGFSLDDAETFTLMRAYRDLDDRQKSQDAFYGSDEWKNGPREAILACIDYSTCMITETNTEILRKALKMGKV